MGRLWARAGFIGALLVMGGSLWRLGPVAAQEPAKATFDARGYSLHACPTQGDRFVCLRLKTDTGETWAMNGGKWQRVSEAARPSPGEYDIALVQYKNSFRALRVERRTGASWYISEYKWAPIAEGTGEPPAGDYTVMIVVVEKEAEAFRIDRRSGTTWQVRKGRWVRIEDPG